MKQPITYASGYALTPWQYWRSFAELVLLGAAIIATENIEKWAKNLDLTFL